MQMDIDEAWGHLSEWRETFLNFPNKRFRSGCMRLWFINFRCAFNWMLYPEKQSAEKLICDIAISAMLNYYSSREWGQEENYRYPLLFMALIGPSSERIVLIESLRLSDSTAANGYLTADFLWHLTITRRPVAESHYTVSCRVSIKPNLEQFIFILCPAYFDRWNIWICPSLWVCQLVLLEDIPGSFWMPNISWDGVLARRTKSSFTNYYAWYCGSRKSPTISALHLWVLSTL